MAQINQYELTLKDKRTVYIEAEEIIDDLDDGMFRFIKDEQRVGEFRKSDVSGWRISWTSE